MPREILDDLQTTLTFDFSKKLNDNVSNYHRNLGISVFVTLRLLYRCLLRQILELDECLARYVVSEEQRDVLATRSLHPAAGYTQTPHLYPTFVLYHGVYPTILTQALGKRQRGRERKKAASKRKSAELFHFAFQAQIRALFHPHLPLPFVFDHLPNFARYYTRAEWYV